jgi:hypothetical protein
LEYGSEAERKAGDVDVGAALLREMIARPSAAYQSVQAAKLGMDKPGGEFRAALEEAVLGDCSLVRILPRARAQGREMVGSGCLFGATVERSEQGYQLFLPAQRRVCPFTF